MPKDNSAVVSGNGNSVVAGENNKLEVYRNERDDAVAEVERLMGVLKDKEKLIEVITSFLLNVQMQTSKFIQQKELKI